MTTGKDRERKRAAHAVGDPQEVLEALAVAELRVVGRLVDASNVALLVTLDPPDASGGSTEYGVYKPGRGERPLWDFPTGRLAHREVASYLVDAAGGWGVVPPTVLREGPLGSGSLQWWVTDPAGLLGAGPGHPSDSPPRPLFDDRSDDAQEAGRDCVVVVPPGDLENGWLPVLSGELADGSPVVVAHADTAELRAVALLDAVLNNSDRKASHLLRDADGHLWGIDHGVTLHSQPKLRTVLWGWAGEALQPAEAGLLDRLARELGGDLPDRLAPLLTDPEIDALAARVTTLTEQGVFPHPSPDWPSVPWPPL